MPLLRRAAPKWKLILTEIGMPNDYIMKHTINEVVVLEIGMSKWLGEHTHLGATLVDLVKALRGMCVCVCVRAVCVTVCIMRVCVVRPSVHRFSS